MGLWVVWTPKHPSQHLPQLDDDEGLLQDVDETVALVMSHHRVLRIAARDDDRARWRRRTAL